MAHKFLVLPDLADLAADLDRVKWYLWHGNVFSALQQLGWIQLDLAGVEPGELPDNNHFKRLGHAVSEFQSYITANELFILNYGERYR